VIAAAGNLGPGGPPRYPAAYAESIAVTAVDLLDRLTSTPTVAHTSTWQHPACISGLAGANGHGKFFDGTSFAAPFVTAEVALLRSAEPQRSPPELKAPSTGRRDRPTIHCARTPRRRASSRAADATRPGR